MRGTSKVSLVVGHDLELLCIADGGKSMPAVLDEHYKTQLEHACQRIISIGLRSAPKGTFAKPEKLPVWMACASPKATDVWEIALPQLLQKIRDTVLSGQ